MKDRFIVQRVMDTALLRSRVESSAWRSPFIFQIFDQFERHPVPVTFDTEEEVRAACMKLNHPPMRAAMRG